VTKSIEESIDGLRRKGVRVVKFKGKYALIGKNDDIAIMVEGPEGLLSMRLWSAAMMKIVFEGMWNADQAIAHLTGLPWRGKL